MGRSTLALLVLFWAGCLSPTLGQTYLSATVRDFTSATSPDFGNAANNLDNAGAEFVNNTLDMFSLPSFKNTSPTSTTLNTFPLWFDSAYARLGLEASYALRFTGSPLTFLSNPFFPIDGELGGNGADANNRYFTLQFRTYFTHTAAALTLTYGSSDDMWIFVNNTLAGSLRGIHTYATASVNFQTLGLVAGLVYPLDVFYAHRSSAHDPQIQIQIPASTMCNADSAGLRVKDMYPFVVAGNGTNLAIPTGASSTVVSVEGQNRLRIVPIGTTAVGSSAWYYKSLPITNGFRTEFSFRIGTNSSSGNFPGRAEGFAFVFQGLGTQARGTAEGALGYNFEKSVAIEFDSAFQSTYDPNGMHIEVHTRYSSAVNGPDASYKMDIVNPPTTALPSSVNFADNRTHIVQISYQPSTTPASTLGSLFVWYDGVMLHRAAVRDTQLRSMFANNLAYFGFTASNGIFTRANVDVWNWRLWVVPPSAPLSIAVPVPVNVTASAAKSVSSQFVVQSNDACSTALPLGGGVIQAVLARDGASTAVSVGVATDASDNGDGTYSVWYWNSTALPYKLFVSLNGQNLATSPFAVTVLPAVASPSRTTFVGTPAPLSSFTAGAFKIVTVTTRDQYGNINANSGASLAVAFSTGSTVGPYFNNGSNYFFNISSTRAGSDSIFVRLNSIDVVGSPFGVTVTATNANGDSSTVQGSQSVVAGTPTSLQVVPRDVYGNNILSDCCPVALTISRVGGLVAPLNVNGVFQASATPTQYNVPFTLTMVGTYTVTATIGTETITNAAAFQLSVAPGVEVASRSFLTVMNMTAGTQSGFDIQAVDANDNIRTTTNDGAPFVATVQFIGSASVASITCGGAFATTAEVTAISCGYTSNGKYTVQLTTVRAGSYQVRVTYSGTPIKSDWSIFTTFPGALSVDQSFLSTAPVAVCGQYNAFTVTARDAFGNFLNGGTDLKDLFSAPIAPQDGSFVTILVQPIVRIGTSSNYTVNWNPSITKVYLLNLNYLSIPISNSGAPSPVTAIPGNPSAVTSLVYGTGIQGGVGGAGVTIRVQSVDSGGNSRTGTADKFRLHINTWPNVNVAVMANEASGVYKYDYNLPPYNAQTPSFWLTVELQFPDGVFTLVGNFTIPVSQPTDVSYHAVVSGDFPAGSVLECATSPTNAQKCCGVCTQPSQANVPMSFFVKNRDEFWNPTTQPNGAQQTMIAILTPTVGDVITVTCPYQGVGPDSFKCTYTTTTTYPLTLTLKFNGIESKATSLDSGMGGVGPLPAIQVVPGPADPFRSVVTGMPLSIEAGGSGVFQVRLADASGNPITTNGGNITMSNFPSTCQVRNVSTVAGVYTYNVTCTLSNAPSAGLVNLRLGANPVLLGGQAYGVIIRPSVISITNSRPRDTGLVFTAGVRQQVFIVARDRFDNALIDQSLQLGAVLANNPGLVVEPTTYNGAGLYSFYITPFVAGSALGFYATLAGGGTTAVTSSLPYGVVPAAADGSHSSVTPFDTNPVAGTAVAITLILRDQYDNAYSFGATNVKITYVVPARVSQSYSPTLNPVVPGEFLLGFLPIISGAYNISIDTQENSVFKKLNLVVPTVNVQPAVIDPAQTDVPYLLTGSWGANVPTQLTLTLKDRFANPIGRGGDQILTTFVTRPSTRRPACAGADVDRAFVTPLNVFPDPVVDNGDGSYTVSLRTTVKGSYSVYLVVVVQGTERGIIACQDTGAALPSFSVTPLAASGAHSLFTRTDVGADPLSMTVTAGKDVKFLIQLRDIYDNDLDVVGGQTMALGSGGFCSAPGQGPIYTNALAAFTTAKTNDGTGTELGGKYELKFTETLAQTSSFVITVNTQFVGSIDSTICRQLNILPSVITQQFYSNLTVVRAAIPSFVIMHAQDQYGNPVSASDGQHYWLAHFVRNNDNTLADYVFDVQSDVAIDGEHHVDFIVAWKGIYTVTITLYQNGVSTSISSGITNLNILPATCAGLNTTNAVRCLDDQCAVDYGTSVGSCGYTCMTGHQCALSPACGATQTDCTCPGGFVGCASNGGGCVPTGECPAASQACAPPYVTCVGSGVCRLAQADCPAAVVCAPGLTICFDGRTCARSAAACNTLLAAQTQVACPTGTVRCGSGACAVDRDDCPTAVSCSAGSVVCGDGSCRDSAAQCPSEYLCYAPTAFRCPGGFCRASVNDCPTLMTCPPSWVKCEAGTCRRTAAECGAQTDASSSRCGYESVRCATGECRPNLLLCPSSITCVAPFTVLCPDFSCVASVKDCAVPTSCTDARRPLMCSDGTCASVISQCPTRPSCPYSAPVLCSNLECVTSSTQCASFSSACPRQSPHRCVDGSCATSVDQCPTYTECPSNAPIRCLDGRCAAAVDTCAKPSKLDCGASGLFKCPNGACAFSLSSCPTTVSCGFDFIRCVDGTCRQSCSDITNVPLTRCSIDQVVCPKTHAGEACASSLVDCPASVSCPPNLPVRCFDRTCQRSIEECSQPVNYEPFLYACPDGTWAGSIFSCSSATSCPPTRPAKCWDETCRLVAEDCPSPPGCGRGQFLCNDGTCVDQVYSCTTTTSCGGGNTVKCSAYSGTGTSACVAHVTDCLDTFNRSIVENTQIAFCPNDLAGLCRDGTCRGTDSSCPSNTICPSFASTLCPDGGCARNPSECNLATNGCPYDEPTKCWDGSCAETAAACPNAGFNLTNSVRCPSRPTDVHYVRCPDGSCIANSFNSTGDCSAPYGCETSELMCADRTCAVKASGNNPSACNTVKTRERNSCPLWRPYKCADGYCARSSIYCPIAPQDGHCSSTTLNAKPVRCADGSCVAGAVLCPVVRDCSVTEVRCGDGSCRRQAALCPVGSTCPTTRPFRCADGYCAADMNHCLLNTNNGCPNNTVRCINGFCDGAASPCTGSSVFSTNGCALNEAKCWNGKCASSFADCDPSNGCPAGRPYLCSTLLCVANSAQCAANSCPSGVLSDGTTCLTPLGCPTQTPYRCVDGSCARYPAQVAWLRPGSSCAATGVVVCDASTPFLCADGSCVKDQRSCRPVLGCPTPGDVLCPDRSCAPAGSCPPGCPMTNPVMCPDGSCVGSMKQCRYAAAADACAAPLVRCYDGSCRASPLECVRLRFVAVNVNTPAWNANTDLSNHNTTCGVNSHDYLCPDGSCLPDIRLCPFVPRCPAVRPLRCDDGSCTNSTCVDMAACAGGLTRCEDGTCRYPCLAYDGCPASAPFFCAGLLRPCVVSREACLARAPGSAAARRLMSAAEEDGGVIAPGEGVQACQIGCERDVNAVAQIVSGNLYEGTNVDVSWDRDGVTRTSIYIPSGALGAPGATLSIRPVPKAVLDTTTQQFNGLILSTPFECSAEGATLRESGDFAFNLTVQSAVDLAKFARATDEDTGSDALANPCEWQANYAMTLQSVGGTSTNCGGIIVVGANTFAGTNSSIFPCPRTALYFSGELIKLETSQAWNGQDPTAQNPQSINFAYFNVTSSGVRPEYSVVCLTLRRVSENFEVYVYDNSGENYMDTKCPLITEATGTIRFTLVPTSATDKCASTGGGGSSAVILPQDICLATIDATTRQWRCVENAPERSLDQLNLQPWYSTMPVATPPNRMTARLKRCDQGAVLTMNGQTFGPVFAFANIDLPVAAPPAEVTCDFVCKYEKEIIGVSVGLGLAIIIGALLICWLVGVRRRYKEKQVQLDDLKDRAAVLDETSGGLGIADDEIEMIANPLIVEMQELEGQITKVNQELSRTKESQHVEINQLKSESERIMAEIERVKSELAKTQKQGPSRAVEAPRAITGTTMTTGAKGGATARVDMDRGTSFTTTRHEFGQVRGTTRKKEFD